MERERSEKEQRERREREEAERREKERLEQTSRDRGWREMGKSALKGMIGKSSQDGKAITTLAKEKARPKVGGTDSTEQLLGSNRW
jgi:hypothetical protein